MAYCGKCLHLDVCKTAETCDGHVPRCKHFMDKDKCSTAQTVVQEGKPLEAFLHPIIAYEGLKDKYLVFNAASGKKIENCFVLRPDRDTAAVDALRTYANSTDNKTLREDIYNWVGKGEPVQEWIPVTERLPEVVESYLVVVKYKYDWEKEYDIDVDVATYNPYENAYIDDCWNTYIDLNEGQQDIHVTHWMPLPKPPEEDTP